MHRFEGRGYKIKRIGLINIFRIPISALRYKIEGYGRKNIKQILMKSLRGKPRSIIFLGFNSLLSQQAAGNLTQERLNS